MVDRRLVIGIIALLAASTIVPIGRRRLAAQQQRIEEMRRIMTADPAEISGTEIDEERAIFFFPGLRRPGGRMVFDPVAHVALRPDNDKWYVFDEHPDGRINFSTNNRGFREDEDTPLQTDAYRVLVLGDSHAEGVVHNAESFANVLERLLDESRPDRAHDVLNAAVGTTGPFDYLAMLDRHAELAPDAVVVSLYSGNDFQDGMRMSDFLTKRRTTKRTPEYTETMLDAMERWPGPVPQGFNQAHLFRFLRQDVGVAVDACVAFTNAIAERCEDLGADLIVVALPSKPEVDGDHDRETVQAILDAMDLNDADLAVNTDMKERYIAGVRAAGIRCVDPAAEMRATTEPFFWREDHHLNVTGHALVAELLLAEFVALTDEAASEVETEPKR